MLKKKSKLAVLFSLALITLLIGTIAYHFLEAWSYLDSLYFSTTTLTTIGYGDLAPTTDISKIFTIVYILTGIGIILGLITTLAERRVERRLDKKVKKN